MARSFKKDRIKLELLTDIDQLNKELEEQHITQFIDMQKLIINISKIMIRIKNRDILNIKMLITSMAGQCRRSFQ